MAEKSSLHAGHRARMRHRLKQTSPAAFADHELLEMLLYHTHARSDTNEIAHALMEAFGSIERLLDTDPARLQTVQGIGETSATLLTLVGELARRYTTQKITDEESDKDVLDTPELLAKYLAPRFIGATRELAYALLLDNSMRICDFFPLGIGSVSSVPISARGIAERAYSKQAAAVVLAHNHPGGVALPSSEDIALTYRLKEALALLEIPLVEHFVFSDKSYSPILHGLETTKHEQRIASPIFDRIKTNFMQEKGEK